MSIKSEIIEDDDKNSVIVEEKYCICRGAYGKRFMIACDGCEEWFHGTCVSVSSDQAKDIEKYFCPKCIAKDSSLKTVYKARISKPEEMKSLRHKERINKKKEVKKTSKKTIDSDSEEGEERTPKESKKREKEKEEAKRIKKVQERLAKREEFRKSLLKEDAKTKLTEEAKFKIPKDHCRPKVEEMVKVEQHIKVCESEVKSAKDDDLKRLKAKILPSVSDELVKKTDKKRTDELKKLTESAHHRQPSMSVLSDDDDVDFNSFLNALSRQAHKTRKSSSSEDEDVDVGVEEVIQKPSKKDVTKKEIIPSKKTLSKIKKKLGRPKKKSGISQTGETIVEKELSEDEEKQCLGPGCRLPARHRSRYCSDACGVLLATKRICTFLPKRKYEAQGAARIHDEKLIEDLEMQQEVSHQRIDELQRQRLVIMNLISKAKATPVEEKGSDMDTSDEENVNDTDEIDCVICGMVCTDKNAVRHMERCYNKFEAKLSWGSTVKCHVTWESPVCDAYDRQQGTYCKKLRVLCPDHKKEKEEHNGICGCPLGQEIRIESDVCTRAKRICNRHIGWEKLRLAEIDMERVEQDLKLEGSFDEMRRAKSRIANRTNLLQMLLNSTIAKSPG